MVKTHEKSKFLRIIDGSELEEIQKKQMVLQVECIQAVEGYKRAYLIECVEAKDYERTTNEGQLAEVREELKKTKETAEEYLQNMNRAMKQRDEIRENIKRCTEDVKTLYETLNECRRIFNGLPEEIETQIRAIEGKYLY